MFVVMTVDRKPVIDPRCGGGCRCPLSDMTESGAFMLRDFYAPGCIVVSDEKGELVRRRAPAPASPSSFELGDEYPTDVRRSA